MAVSSEMSPIPEEEVKRYTIHISSKYLNLTKQKLELTRLPHDVPQPQQNEWWEPKSTVEPLVDYWLEQYSWRDQEADFNANIPQFRTAIRTASSGSPVRVHVIHSESTHANAVPLLMIPPFPFTNLSLAHLINVFTTPDNPAENIPFHLVIPSLPGLGFSDAINSNKHMLPLIAEMFDALMKRLGYKYYLATNAAPSPNSLTDIDFRLVNHLALSFPDSCLGVHVVSPPFNQPTWQTAPLEWLKWKTAAWLQTPCLGYTRDDITAFREQAQRQAKKKQQPLIPGMGIGMSKVFEPNTLAYALCDSPAGLLLFVVMVLRVLGPNHGFSEAKIIQLAELMWLPGPEGTMRLWAHCSSNFDDLPTSSRKPRVGITAFSGTKSQETQGQRPTVLPASSADVHTCLAWGKSHYNIVSSQRVSGSAGLLAWERPEVIAGGVRGLAKAIIASDSRLQDAKEPGVALLEQVVVGDGQVAPAETSGTTIQGDASPIPVPADPLRSDQVKLAASEEVRSQRRPQTPIFPRTGESSQEVLRDSTDASQTSSGGSRSTIKPFKNV
ncbi:hypothetical protein QQS21_004330 [Conoideocrella luteorostrata]|uniref:Epoxide hydrolase N-terminal domain-containing protein n=1 Tax=Conoideocrella luteorostrata TaxID=1105319 RepID=A0AAJ0CUJ8_9HYPO|nr:hypothetical protein QQS21_004330 [Conoideocrella luteorostrata]